MPAKIKAKELKTIAIAEESIINKIYFLRGQKVMLDSDLAKLYGVTTSRLNEQVKRNIDRFPEDFMFELTSQEFDNLISQIAISSWGGRRKLPLAFTEKGVAMLSSVLHSKKAIQINIAIMRTFSKLREIISTHKDLQRKIEEMEKKYDKNFRIVFAAIKELFDRFKEPENPNKMPIGFHVRWW